MKWSDEYWPLLVKIYKKKPEGVKAMYSQQLVELALELHITPQELHRKMLELRNPKTPYLQHIAESYASQSRLNRAVKQVMQNQGLGTGGDFFEGVETMESWEKDFRPYKEEERLMPISLIVILDLYFQLTLSTMVSDTEEIQDIARMMHIPVSLVLQVMELFRYCDPYMNTDDIVMDPLLFAVNDIWTRYGNDNERLTADAALLRHYWL